MKNQIQTGEVGMKKYHLRVPCSTSNLGPGFDCLGCALQLYNEFEVEFIQGGANRIEFHGPEAGGLRPSPNNLFFYAISKFYHRIKKPAPAVRAKAFVHVPNARGLGSSATAIVAALMAANDYSGASLSKKDLVRIATEIEGHPDNVTPATLGGITVSLKSPDGHIIVSQWKLHDSAAFVLLSPDYEVSTKSARGALPSKIPHRDAVANIARVPLLVNALANGEFEDLPVLMQDRLHEPYRENLYPHFAAIKKAAIDSGAAAVSLSGAGPTMLAVCRKAIAEQVADDWAKALHSFDLAGTARVLDCDMEGAEFLPCPVHGEEDVLRR